MKLYPYKRLLTPRTDGEYQENMKRIGMKMVKNDLWSKHGVKNTVAALSHCLWRYSGRMNSDRLFTFFKIAINGRPA
jgi:hypothetical protein